LPQKELGEDNTEMNGSFHAANAGTGNNSYLLSIARSGVK